MTAVVADSEAATATAAVSDKEEAASRGNGEEKDNGGEGIEKRVACAEE